MGLDDTIERRRGNCRQVYRDSSSSQVGGRWSAVVKSVHWFNYQTLANPSQRYLRSHRHTDLTNKQAMRLLPRTMVVVAFSELMWALCQMSRPVHIITRLRLDAQLYRPAPLRRSKQMGRPGRWVDCLD